MKLKPNMYVRTKDGEIGKINKIIGKYIFINTNQYAHFKHHIKITSNNIIGLIEVGDYVNGYIVLDIIKDNLGKTYIECGCKDEIAHNYIYDTFYNEDIKSIVTKEQFSSMEYRLGE